MAPRIGYLADQLTTREVECAIATLGDIALGYSDDLSEFQQEVLDKVTAIRQADIDEDN